MQVPYPCVTKPWIKGFQWFHLYLALWTEGSKKTLLLLYPIPPSILTLVTWVRQIRLAFGHSARRLAIGPPALAKPNSTVCSLACRWRLWSAFFIDSGPLLDNNALLCSSELSYSCIDNHLHIFFCCNFWQSKITVPNSTFGRSIQWATGHCRLGPCLLFTPNFDCRPLTVVSWLLILDSWLLSIDTWRLTLTLDSWLLTLDLWLLNLDSWLLTLDSWPLTLDFWHLTLDS